MAKVLVVLSFGMLTVLATPQSQSNHELEYSSNGRIVGGQHAEEGQFPYIVSLRSGSRHFCGGSILNEHWILTAAHCMEYKDRKSVFAVAGSHLLSSGGDKYKISKIIIHKNWDEEFNKENDIALLKVSSPIEFNDEVQPISIESDYVHRNVEVVLCGWGDLRVKGRHPNNLQFLDLRTVSISQCDRAYEKKVTNRQICTLTHRGEGACHGDSGGPLASNGRLIGIVSWGYPCAKGRPDVFTRVSAYTDWIHSNMEES